MREGPDREVPLRYLTGEQPVTPELRKPARELEELRDATLPGDEAYRQEIEQELLQLYQTDEAVFRSGGESVVYKRRVLTGSPNLESYRIPPTTETVARLKEVIPDFASLSPGEQACAVFRVSDYTMKGFHAACYLLRDSAEAEAAVFVRHLCESGAPDMWGLACSSFPDVQVHRSLAAKIRESESVKAALKGLEVVEDREASRRLVDTVLIVGNGLDLSTAVKLSGPQFHAEIVDALFDGWGKKQGDWRLAKLGLHLALQHVSGEVKEDLLARFLAADDPQFAQLAIGALPDNESQLPFGAVILKHRDRDAAEKALRKPVYGPLRGQLESLIQTSE